MSRVPVSLAKKEKTLSEISDIVEVTASFTLIEIERPKDDTELTKPVELKPLSNDESSLELIDVQIEVEAEPTRERSPVALALVRQAAATPLPPPPRNPKALWALPPPPRSLVSPPRPQSFPSVPLPPGSLPGLPPPSAARLPPPPRSSVPPSNKSDITRSVTPPNSFASPRNNFVAPPRSVVPPRSLPRLAPPPSLTSAPRSFTPPAPSLALPPRLFTPSAPRFTPPPQSFTPTPQNFTPPPQSFTPPPPSPVSMRSYSPRSEPPPSYSPGTPRSVTPKPAAVWVRPGIETDRPAPRISQPPPSDFSDMHRAYPEATPVETHYGRHERHDRRRPLLRIPSAEDLSLYGTRITSWLRPRRGMNDAAMVFAFVIGFALLGSIAALAVRAFSQPHEARATSGVVVTVAGPGGTVVPSAAVYVDGNLACQAAPCTLGTLEPGMHFIQVQAAGFATTAPRAIVVNGPELRTVNFDLIADLRGSAPTAALAPAPAPAPALTQQQPVQVENLGFDSEQRAPISESPRPARAIASGPGTLNMNSIPSSNVVLDGKPLGPTPQSVRVSPGPHSVLFVSSEYGRVGRSVTVAPGSSQTVAVRLQ